MMSGYVFVLCNCIGCGGRISVNPEKCPSVRINGRREPLCRSCAEMINRRREDDGLERQEIHPDAYNAQALDPAEDRYEY